MFVITLLCGIAYNTCRAYYIKKRLKYESEQYSLNGGLCIVCSVAFFFLSGCRFDLSWYSVLLGVAFGLVSMGNSVLLAKAIRIGPFGYTSVIVNLSTALTALSGALFWNESLSLFKILGIVLMLACFFFAIDTEKDNGKKANTKWFILCLLALLTGALIGILQKIHQSSEYKSEIYTFLFVAFLTSAIISFCGYAVVRKGENRGDDCKPSKKDFLWFFVVLIICGMGTAGNNVLNLYLSGVTETAIFFPIVNGVPLLASLVVSFFVFGEKLKRKQLIGLLIGIVAIICLFI